MADDNYEYPNQEDQTSYANGPMSGTDSIKSILKNRSILLSLGMVVATYLLTHLLTYMFGEKAEKDTTPAPAKVTTTPPPATPHKAEDIPPIEPQPVTAPSDHSQLHQTLEKLQQQLATTDTHLNDLHHSVENAASTQSATRHTLEGLAGQVSSLSDRLHAIEVKLAPKPKPKKVHRPPMKHFVIRAIIDGRAWVQQPGHPATTVAVGDPIPTYGVVTAIAPQQGHVMTSSHRIIRFSPEDH